MSCNVITSDSIPTTSEMWAYRGVCRRRGAGSARAGRNALAICSRIARWGSSTPAVTSERVSAPRESIAGELAWIVVSEPSWPVFIAWSMSSVSAAANLADDDPDGRACARVPDEARGSLIRRRLRCSWARDSSVITCSAAAATLQRPRSYNAHHRARNVYRHGVERRRLAGTCAAGDEHVELALDARARGAPRCARRQRPERDRKSLMV